MFTFTFVCSRTVDNTKPFQGVQFGFDSAALKKSESKSFSGYILILMY